MVFREVNTIINLSDEGRAQSADASLPDIVSRISRVDELWSGGEEVCIVRSLVEISRLVCPVHTVYVYMKTCYCEASNP